MDNGVIQPSSRISQEKTINHRLNEENMPQKFNDKIISQNMLRRAFVKKNLKKLHQITNIQYNIQYYLHGLQNTTNFSKNYLSSI
jgi:hypothetical protein